MIGLAGPIANSLALARWLIEMDSLHSVRVSLVRLAFAAVLMPLRPPDCVLFFFFFGARDRGETADKAS